MSTNYLNSPITQYDKSFDELFNGEVAKKGFACSYFSVLTAWRFMKQYQPTSDVHVDNVTCAVKITKELSVTQGIHFNELIDDYTSLKSNSIVPASVELIKTNVIQYTDIFPPLAANLVRYAVILLKNEKYIVVLVDDAGYYVRDCHEITQYNFKTLNELTLHLENTYQFATDINVTGVEYFEYSSIEFMIVTDEFETLLTGLLGIDITPAYINKSVDPLTKDLHEKDFNYLAMLDDYYNKEMPYVYEDDEPESLKSNSTEPESIDEFVNFDDQSSIL